MTEGKITAPKPDGAAVRRLLFSPETPDFAFLTLEEVMAAFDTSDSTLRYCRRLGKFIEPKEIPGGKGYFVGDLRAFLQRISGYRAAGRYRPRT